MNKDLAKQADLKIKIEKEISDKGNASDKKIVFWEKIAKVSIYLLVFLTPLFFLPWTLDALDFNKHFLLIFLVFVAILSWILKALAENKIELNASFLNIPILVFLLIYGLSTVFSLFPSGSFWGWPLNVSAGFLTVLYFVFLYFLISNIFSKEKELLLLLVFLVFSGFVVALFSAFQIFGRFILPWDFTKDASFNTVGTTNALALFLAVLLPLVIALALRMKVLGKWLLLFMGFVIFSVLALINFKLAWFVLVAGAIILFIFGIFNPSKEERKLVPISMALLVVALLFVIVAFNLPYLPQLPSEVLPSQRAGMDVAKNVLLGSPVFGTGPGTFVYSFSQHKPEDINQTVFWNLRFSSGASEILDKLTTIGILGLLAFLFVIGAFFWNALKIARGKSSEAENILNRFLFLGVFASFAGIVLSAFLYPANFTLSFCFWVLLGSFTALTSKNKRIFGIQSSSKATIAIPLVLVFLLIFGLGFLLVGSQKYFAETRYLAGLQALERNDLDGAIQKIEGAIEFSPSLDVYWRDLSQAYLLKLNETLQRQDLSSEEIAFRAQNLIRGAVNSAMRATELNKENAANWSTAGFIYWNLIGFLEGADDWALTAYQRALDLEPINPYIFTEIGRIYIAKADLALEQQLEADKKTNLKLASEHFEKALSLKNDYTPAHFLQAMVYVREERAEEAIVKLEQTKQVVPFDVGLLFQLGILYYNENQFEKAKRELEAATRIDENHSNARYFLGLIYDKEGKKQEALLQFEKIAALNPGNEEIKIILTNLREGKPALENIVLSEPPIEEASLETPELLEIPEITE